MLFSLNFKFFRYLLLLQKYRNNLFSSESVNFSVFFFNLTFRSGPLDLGFRLGLDMTCTFSLIWARSTGSFDSWSRSSLTDMCMYPKGVPIPKSKLILVHYQIINLLTFWVHFNHLLGSLYLTFRLNIYL